VHSVVGVPRQHNDVVVVVVVVEDVDARAGLAPSRDRRQGSDRADLRHAKPFAKVR
jgi:hypothetical protein